MQVNVSFTRARSAILAAAGLVSLITLGGCAGGGGGGGGLTPQVPFTYPASLKDATSSDTVDGFISPYALNTTTNELVSTKPSVSGSTPSAGTITITVNDIKLPDSTTEPGFSVTFDPSASTKAVSNSPLDSLLPACTGCLRTATATATDTSGSTVTFTYLDPSVFVLNYSVLGIWEKPTTNGSAAWPEVGGAFSAGVLTRGVDLPTTGSASYAGYFIGRYVTSATSGALAPAGTYLVGANASATADFGAGTVSLSTTNTQIALDSGGTLGPPATVSGLNLSSTAIILRGSTSNSFGGTAITNSGGLSGPMQGGFYGAPATSGDFAPPELGGSLAVTNSSQDQSMAGSFALKK